MLNSTDVFVIGGGPAGLAAAIAARQQGFRVVVADGAKPPIDKPCGEALMPDAIAALEELGVALSPSDARPLRGVRFLSSGLSAEADFPSDCDCLSIRRTVLHDILTERAAELGVDLLWQSAVTRISGDEVWLGDRGIRTSWIIGADGSNSRVRKWANLEPHSSTGLRYSFRRHYRVAPWTDRMEIYWGKRSQGYMTAVKRTRRFAWLWPRASQNIAWTSLCSISLNSARGWPAQRRLPPKEERSPQIAN